ncbi:MAG: hypothetical protein CMP85_02200 [Gammaproteobacteria bacterium]|nr:hypothetical protein [Gammaproteobacteria bacterium]|tara:strand:- start:942 stop:1283 length:342 start_codon:yes stop_codon:yes gene_type:complete
MKLSDLLFNRWQLARPFSFSSESLSIGQHDVWVYVAATPTLNYAVTSMLDGHTYYLKLHWGTAAPRVFALQDLARVKDGIAYLLQANNILETYGTDIEAYMLWYTSRSSFRHT